MAIFVGNKAKPSYLIEVNKKNKTVSIYTPDRHSKDEDFYEKYALGKVVYEGAYTDIIFLKKPVAYKQCMYTPEVIFILKIKNKYLMISNHIELLHTL